MFKMLNYGDDLFPAMSYVQNISYKCMYKYKYQ